MARWGTRFATPAAATNLVVSYDTTTAWVTLTWDVWPGSDDLFHQYRVYRQVGSGDFVRVDGDRLLSRTSPTFVDEEAPLRTPVTYRVSVYNGAIESEQPHLEGDVYIDLVGWWLGVPGRSDLTMELRRVTSHDESAVANARAHNRLRGRATLVTRGTKQIETGSFSMIVPWTEIDRYDQFMRVVAAEVPHFTLRTGVRQTYRVQFDTIERSWEGPGNVTLTCPWWGVSLLPES